MFESINHRLRRHSNVLFSRLGISLGILIFILLVVYQHQRMNTQLTRVYEQASRELAPLLVTYEISGDPYTVEEILMLTRFEVQGVLGSSSPVFLQLINTKEKVYYDSRSSAKSHEARNITHLGEMRSQAVIEKRAELPLGESWELRAGISLPSYLRRQLSSSGVGLALIALLFGASRALGEALRRRRFDQLVSTMLGLLHHTNETTFIEAVPEIVARLLNFDAVGLYLCEGYRIIPKAAFLPSGGAEKFLASTDRQPITADSAYPEAVAFRENKSILVNKPQDAAVHKAQLQIAGPSPYVIAVMRGEARSRPIGLLTAQRRRGLQPEDQNFLDSAAQLIALNIQRFRSKDAQVRMYQQMVRSTRTISIGTVVPYIAHNMKTPLAIVAQLAKSIKKQINEEHDASEVTESLDRIRTQVDHCFELLQSISQYNRLDKSLLGSTRIIDGLDKVCNFFREYFRIKGIALDKQYYNEKVMNFVVEIEELDFLQVVTNLLVNAEEALIELVEGSDRQQLRCDPKIAVQAVTLDGESRIAITIEDNGPGILSEEIDLIFDQDFTTKPFGAGVGLPYCRRVIEQAGGILAVESRRTEGTRFTIELPAKHCASDAPEAW